MFALVGAIYPVPRGTPVAWFPLDKDSHVPDLNSQGAPLSPDRFMTVGGTVAKTIMELDPDTPETIDAVVSSLMNIPQLFPDDEGDRCRREGHEQETRGAVLAAEMIAARTGRPVAVKHGKGLYRHTYMPALTSTLDFEGQQREDPNDTLMEFGLECKYSAGKNAAEPPKLHDKYRDCEFVRREQTIPRRVLEIAHVPVSPSDRDVDPSVVTRHLLALTALPLDLIACVCAFVTPTTSIKSLIGEPVGEVMGLTVGLERWSCPCPLPPFRVAQLMLQAIVSGLTRFRLVQLTREYAAYLDGSVEANLQWLQAFADRLNTWSFCFEWYWTDNSWLCTPVRESLNRISEARIREAARRAPDVPLSTPRLDVEGLLRRRPAPEFVRKSLALARCARGRPFASQLVPFGAVLDQPPDMTDADIDPLVCLLKDALPAAFGSGSGVVCLAWIVAYDVCHPTTVTTAVPFPRNACTTQLRLLPCFLWQFSPLDEYCIETIAVLDHGMSRRMLSARGKAISHFNDVILYDDRKLPPLPPKGPVGQFAFPFPPVYYPVVRPRVRQDVESDEKAYGTWMFYVQPSSGQWRALDHLRVLDALRRLGITTARTDDVSFYGGFTWEETETAAASASSGDTNARVNRHAAMYSNVPEPGRDNVPGVLHRFSELAARAASPSVAEARENLFRLHLPGTKPVTGKGLFVVTTVNAKPSVMALLARAFQVHGHRVQGFRGRSEAESNTLGRLYTNNAKLRRSLLTEWLHHESDDEDKDDIESCDDAWDDPIEDDGGEDHTSVKRTKGGSGGVVAVRKTKLSSPRERRRKATAAAASMRPLVLSRVDEDAAEPVPPQRPDLDFSAYTDY